MTLENDQTQLLMRNAEQILAIVAATFGTEPFDTASGFDPCLRKDTDIEDLACRWQQLSETAKGMKMGNGADQEWTTGMSQVRHAFDILESLLMLTSRIQWLRDAQKVLSSMASNYDVSRLTMGQIAAVTAVLLAAFAAYQNAGGLSIPAVPFTLITTAYGVMMFASSYVEEEQHFWYYCTTAWVACISWRGFRG